MVINRGKAKYSKMLNMAYSVFFACMVYIVFSIYARDTRNVSIPITVRANSQYVNNSNIPKFVNVVMKGSQDLIYGIDADRISARLDLSSVYMEGIYIIPVEIVYDLGVLNSAKVEIYSTQPNIRVSMVKRPDSVSI